MSQRLVLLGCAALVVLSLLCLDGQCLSNQEENSTSNQAEREATPSESDKLRADSDGVALSSNDITDYDGADDDDGDDDDNVDEAPTSSAAERERESRQGNTSAKLEFSWKHHQDDHGIYSNRSLMSTANIVHHSDQDADTEHVNELELALDNPDDHHSEFGWSGKRKPQDDYLDPLKTSDFAEKEWQLMFRALDSAFDGMLSPILQELIKQTNLIDEVLANLRPECRRDLFHIRNSVKKHKLWALRMLDSNGKLPSGLSYGRFASPGDYEECLAIKVDELARLKNQTSIAQMERHKFHGKYCLLDFRLPLPERPRDKVLSVHEPVLNLTGTELLEKFPEVSNYSAYASIFYEVGYLHGFCLPSTCQAEDVARALGRALEGLHVIVNNTVDCEERPAEPVPLTRSQWVSLVLFGLVFLNAGLASYVYHKQPRGAKAANAARKISSNQDKPGARGQTMLTDGRDTRATHKKQPEASERGNKLNLKQWLQKGSAKKSFYADCFSIQKNFERLAKPDPRGLAFVHYTRIVAMALTVITHTAAMGTLQAVTKPADASNNEQIFRDFIPQMMANAFSSIQVFFFMAGFMLVISTLPSIERDRGHISFVEYAVKRAIRLMPGLAATIGVNFLWPLFVDGPMLTYFNRVIVVPCESTWWRTLSFLSNFDHVERICLRHSYFSASDYQLHLMAFPLLVLLYKQPMVALLLSGLLTLGGFVAQVIMVLTKTLLPFIMVDYIDKEAFFNIVHYIHHPVWNHMSAFFYGFIIGYLVAKQIRVNLSAKAVKRVWCLMIPALLASIYAPYYWNHYKRPIHKWQMVVFIIVDRFVLLSSCAWISYGSMVLGQPARNKPRNKPTAVAANPNPQPELANGANLPDTVGLPLAETKVPQIELDGKSVAEQLEFGSQAGGGALTVPASLPRQRSSPNFENPHQFLNQLEHRRVSKTLSSGDLSKPDSAREFQSAQNAPSQDEQQTTGKREVGGGPEPLAAAAAATTGPGQEQQAPQRKRARPITDVNTLCLMLSRLTFQLYLFNMVVLWIDVNHSKYYWFFSYYFIITKSFAVYVCSSLMALVFFVTLESPSLTLYIAWVKSRAVARAERQARRKLEEQEATRQSGSPNIDQGQTQCGSPRLSPAPSYSDRSVRGSPGGPTSFDGLCMRSSTTGSFSPTARDHRLRPTKPTFSFIDLSSTPSAQSGETAQDQTKM